MTECKNCGKYERDASYITSDGDYCSLSCLHKYEKQEKKKDKKKAIKEFQKLKHPLLDIVEKRIKQCKHSFEELKDEDIEKYEKTFKQ